MNLPEQFIRGINNHAGLTDFPFWEISTHLESWIWDRISRLGADYAVVDGVAIHREARVEEGAILKAPVIVGEGCFIAAGAYLRGGVYLSPGCKVGPGVELKSLFAGSDSRFAHFNYVGDSWVGSDVNFEAGSVVANCWNERTNKHIRLYFEGRKIDTEVEKFGALIGDHCRIGANAVLSPGTLLPAGSIVSRLELVNQDENKEGH